MRNALCLVPKSTPQMVAATRRTVFVQTRCGQRARAVARGRGPAPSRFPWVAQLLDDAEEEVLTYLSFPPEHWRQIWSNNPPDRMCASGPSRQNCRHRRTSEKAGTLVRNSAKHG